MDIWEKKSIWVNFWDGILGDLPCDVYWQRETLALNLVLQLHIPS